MTIKIRKARRGDVKEVIRLSDELSEHLYKTTKKRIISVQRNESRLLDKKIRGERFLFVAEDSKKILGFLVGHTIDTSFYMLGMIDDIYISKEARGLGIGSKLIKRFNTECKKKGVKTVFVITPEKNKDAVNFYKSNGFRIMKSSHLYMRI